MLLAAALGCGAVFNGGPARVNVTSSPADADVWVDGINYGVTPVVLELDKKKEHQVSFKRAGYHDVSIPIGKSFRGRYVVFDVLGGLLPVIIDAASQSWYVLDRDVVHANLRASDGSDGRDGAARHGKLSDEQMKRILGGEPATSVIGSAALPSK
jgi:hypothetical protein